MTWEEHGRRTADPAQVVMEGDRPRRLGFTWHTSTQWARAVGVEEDQRAVLAAESGTSVGCETGQVGPMVKLVVVHEGFDPAGTLIGMCSRAGPNLLSSLTSLLETGEPLPAPGVAAHAG
jgi:hypothetical protein